MAQTFDSLGYSKRLIAAGQQREVAEAHAEAARDYIVSDLVTKSDLRNALVTQTVAFGVMLATAVGILAAVLRV